VPRRQARFIVLILLIIVLLALAALGGYFLGKRQRPSLARTDAAAPASTPPSTAGPPPAAQPTAKRAAESRALTPAPAEQATGDRFGDEKARLIRSRDEEVALLRRELADRDAALLQHEAFARERERLFGELADARSETARYRQLIVDIENNAPPPILSGPAGPDDLKLIVGVGPVLERMLHNLGITTFRQIARWTDRDIGEFDTKLPEFPGRIARDQWVTQARSLHQSKYGERL
jgi:predicted flap endonuclease-1-like 5' DNA nuclease